MSDAALFVEGPVSLEKSVLCPRLHTGTLTCNLRGSLAEGKAVCCMSPFPKREFETCVSNFVYII